MAKNLFARYIWELTTIYRAGRITLKELNERWPLAGLLFV